MYSFTRLTIWLACLSLLFILLWWLFVTPRTEKMNMRLREQLKNKDVLDDSTHFSHDDDVWYMNGKNTCLCYKHSKDVPCVDEELEEAFRKIRDTATGVHPACPMI